jgi:hypothetical protein
VRPDPLSEAAARRHELTRDPEPSLRRHPARRGEPQPRRCPVPVRPVPETRAHRHRDQDDTEKPQPARTGAPADPGQGPVPGTPRLHHTHLLRLRPRLLSGQPDRDRARPLRPGRRAYHDRRDQPSRTLTEPWLPVPEDQILKKAKGKEKHAGRACADAVRDCPWFHPPEPPRARTYDGQGLPRRSLPSAYAQVRRHIGTSEPAVCKTVGSAYVGSNPTPATTCGNSPLAANSRLGGLFFSVPWCVTLSRCGPLCCGVHGRIADGVGPPGRSV